MSEKEYSLIEQFMRVSRLLFQQHHHNHMAHGPMGNPYRGQGRVLKLLKLTPEISQKDLLELLDMRPQSLGELLSKLERDGYITRTPLESDKRVMLIQLTDKGAEVGSDGTEQPAYDDLFACLSEEEQATLSGYLDRVGDVLERQFADDKDWADPRWHNDRRHEHGGGFGHRGRGGPYDWRR